MSSTCHMPCAYTHPIGHVHLVQRISILGIEGREARWSGDSEHGTANERRRHLTAIRELARYAVCHPSFPNTWKSESEPTPRVADVRQYDPQPCRYRVHLL